MQKFWRSVIGLALGLLLVVTLGGNPALAATSTSSAKTAAPTAGAISGKVQARPQASSTAPSLMPPEIQQILDRGTLTVAVLGRDNSPFFMELEDGQMGGLDIQIAQALAEQLGVKLKINRSAQTFDDVVDTVYRHEADLAISKISRTLKRARRVRFSDPYLKMRQGLLVNRLQLAQQPQGSSMVETIRNLSGKVGVIQESSYVGFLKQKFPQADIVEFPTWQDTVDAVVGGEILAAYRDELEIKKVVRTKPDASLQLQTIALTDTQDSLGAVLPWDSIHLLAFVDQYLETMATQYTVDLVLDEFADYWSSQTAGKS